MSLNFPIYFSTSFLLGILHRLVTATATQWQGNSRLYWSPISSSPFSFWCAGSPVGFHVAEYHVSLDSSGWWHFSQSFQLSLYCQASYGLFLSGLLNGFVMIRLLSYLFMVCLMVLSWLDCFCVESCRHNAPVPSLVCHPICEYYSLSVMLLFTLSMNIFPMDCIFFL